MPRLEATWRQIAPRYKDRPDRLYLRAAQRAPRRPDRRTLAGDLFPKLLAIVRESNPDRLVIVGPGHWNNVDHLAGFKLPEDDRMLIGTFHYYSPFHFTHQGAEWAEGQQRLEGRDLVRHPGSRSRP